MTFKRSVALALGLGALGLFFRLSIWSIAWDSGTRLLGKPGLVLMFNLFFAVCAVVVALVVRLRWPRGRAALPPYETATPLRGILRFAAALCAAAGGGLLLYSLLQAGGAGMVLLLCAGLMVVQGAVMALLSILRRTDRIPYATWLLLPAFSSCFFNIGMYQQLGAEPNPQVYMWPVLALLLSTAAWVNYTGFAYQRQSGRQFSMLAHLALLTLPVGLAAPLPLAWRVYLLSPLLWFWAALLSLRVPPTLPDLPEDDEATPDDSPSATINVVVEEDDLLPPGEPPRRLRQDGDEANGEGL